MFRDMLLAITLLTAVTQCSYYDNGEERCKIKEYYNYDGIPYERCYE